METHSAVRWLLMVNRHLLAELRTMQGKVQCLESNRHPEHLLPTLHNRIEGKIRQLQQCRRLRQFDDADQIRDELWSEYNVKVHRRLDDYRIPWSSASRAMAGVVEPA